MARIRWGLVLGVVVASLVNAATASATPGTADQAALAAKFAPVIRMVGAPTACGPGLPYVPTDVQLLFDNPEVALRGPWGPNDLVKVAPSAQDLAAGLFDYHLDFPGDALDPGCGYL